jgi:hypothetical protein
MKPGISQTGLLVLLSLWTTFAKAQTNDLPINEVVAVPTARAIASPIAPNAGASTSENAATAPANVLDDVPRDVSPQQPPAACNNELPTSSLSAACRRWMQIARIL